MKAIFEALRDRLKGHGHRVFVGKNIIDPDQVELPCVVIHMGEPGSEVDDGDAPVERSVVSIVVQYIDEFGLDDPLLEMLGVAEVLQRQMFEKRRCNRVDNLNGTALRFSKNRVACALHDSWDRVGIVEISASALYVSEVE